MSQDEPVAGTQIDLSSMTEQHSSRMEFFRIPQFVQFEITYACNSHCVFCYNPFRVSPINEKTVKGILSSLRQSQVPLIQLIGGEVTLIPDLNDFIEFLSPVSNVTIVSNGINYRTLSSQLAGLYISLHGVRDTHERLTNNPNTYSVITSNISRYAADGHYIFADVILTSQNYEEVYEICRVARELGMRGVFINRYENGGLGAKNSRLLMPTLAEFRKGLEQMVRAKEELGIEISFGTAIPFCADTRLLTSGLAFSCGMGTWFAVIGPNGDFRICNQSKRVYGNILETPLEALWLSPELDDYRSLEWVTGACSSCAALSFCGGGCRVDSTAEAEYCPDFFVRKAIRPIVKTDLDLLRRLYTPPSVKDTWAETPSTYRIFRTKPFVKVNDHYEERYIVKRFETLVTDAMGCDLVRLVHMGTTAEYDMIKYVNDKYPGIPEAVIRCMCTQFVQQDVLSVLS